MRGVISAELQSALDGLGATVVERIPVSGGDISAASRLTLSDGRCLFLKTLPGAPAGMFAAEAAGLAWLKEANGPRIPDVVAVGAAFLLLPWIAPGRSNPQTEDTLGRQLAALHRAGAPTFGAIGDNFIGSLPQDNRPLSRWADFYRQRRLLPQIRLAASALSHRTLRRLDLLLHQLDDRVGPDEPPARLHGDLWGGNLHIDARGQPWLIDPAAHAGHREVDLAMMKLFGGFSARTFSAYAEVYPLASGHWDRVVLYQLYYLLVHVNLHGSGWVGSVEGALDRLGV